MFSAHILDSTEYHSVLNDSLFLGICYHVQSLRLRIRPDLETLPCRKAVEETSKNRFRTV